MGGASTGGVYSVAGTIDQPDAGTTSGDSFTLQGGFRAFAVATQTPGAPLLAVTRSNTVVIVSWPASAEGFGLVSRSDLVTGSWETVTNEPSWNGTRKEVLLPATPPAQRFFQFSKPGSLSDGTTHFRSSINRTVKTTKQRNP